MASARSLSSDFTASIWAPRRERSRLTAWAASGSFQSVGSSTRAFSSSSLRRAGSQSKTPPEQFDRLLDVGLRSLDIRSHGKLQSSTGGRNSPSGSSIQSSDVVGGLLALRRRRGGVDAAGRDERQLVGH